MSNEHNGDGVTVLPGGTIRLGSKAPADSDAPASEMLRSGVGDGSTITMGRDGDVRVHGGVTTHQNVHQVDQSRGVLASARSPGGSRSAPLNDHSVVTLRNGMETSIANAINLGEVARDGVGRYRDTGFDSASGIGESVAPAPATSAAPVEVGLLPQAELSIDAVSNSLPHGLTDGVIHATLTKGAVAAAQRFGGHSTMEQADLQQHLEFVEQAFQGHLAHALSKQGVDVVELAEWAQRHQPQQWAEARARHAFTRSTAGYAGIVDAYLRGTAPAPERLAEQGVKQRVVNGEPQLYFAGAGWLSIKVARNAGLIQ